MAPLREKLNGLFMSAKLDKKHIDGLPFTPIPGFPPVTVSFEVPADASQPNAFQLELLRRIQPEFPRLWSLVIDDLLRSYEYEVFRHPEKTLTAWHIFIPTWDFFHRDSSEVEGVDTYTWCLHPWFADAPELQGSGGIDSRFDGLTYLDFAVIL